MPKIDKDADVEIKLDSAAGILQEAISLDKRRGLFEHPGLCVVAIVELTSKSYTGHAAGEDKDPQVKLRMTLAEVAQDEQQAEQILQVMRAMMRKRKMNETLDELGPGAHDAELAVADALAAHPSEAEFEAHKARQRRSSRVEHHE